MAYEFTKTDLIQSSNLLRKFFFPQIGKEEMIARLSRESEIDVMAVGTDGVNSISRVFAIQDKELLTTVGGAEVRIYPGSKLKEQLVIKYDDDNIWFSKMGGELIGLSSTRLAVELAYFCVEPEFQGKGIGKELFYRSVLSTLGEVHDLRCSLFTLAKGVYSGSGKGQLIRDYLLKIEEDTNGAGVNGTAIVTGTKVPLREMEIKFEVNRSCFKPRDESMATQELAQRWGWKMLGLSKNLSPIWGTSVFLPD